MGFCTIMTGILNKIVVPATKHEIRWSLSTETEVVGGANNKRFILVGHDGTEARASFLSFW